MKEKLTSQEKMERQKVSKALYRQKNRQKLRLKQLEFRKANEFYRLRDNFRRRLASKKVTEKRQRDKYCKNYEQSKEYKTLVQQKRKLARKICFMN